LIEGIILPYIQLSDWYNISRTQVEQRGGWRLFKKHRSLEDALRSLYPNYPWHPSSFRNSAKAPPGFWRDQTNLLVALKKAEAKIGIIKVSFLWLLD